MISTPDWLSAEREMLDAMPACGPKQRYGMSAIPPLSGDKQICGERAGNGANGPSRHFASAQQLNPLGVKRTIEFVYAVGESLALGSTVSVELAPLTVCSHP
jgi:hypothetical protein